MKESATFGGGCFWCLEAVFQRQPGVTSVVSGYTGGRKSNPTYKDICSGTTGHAEVVQIDFDPGITSYDKLLTAFWACHDPTTLNRQGADTGTQYRSIILTDSEEQKRQAAGSRDAEQKNWPDPIVTEIVPLDVFYKAEDYHQNYFNDNPGQGYCNYVIRPKLKKMNL